MALLLVEGKFWRKVMNPRRKAKRFAAKPIRWD